MRTRHSQEMKRKTGWWLNCTSWGLRICPIALQDYLTTLVPLKKYWPVVCNNQAAGLERRSLRYFYYILIIQSYFPNL